MSQHENESMNRRQVATNKLSAMARLDRPTETRLYELFYAYFRRGEEVRAWNIWNDVPWEETGKNPSPALVEAVWSAYQEDTLLPDYSARAIQILRASRGRTWFLNRWSYEEGKHLLGLNEWLVRSGAFTDTELREATETLLQNYRWEPEFIDGIAVFAEFLAWELRETDRFRALKAMAEAEGDLALTALLTRIVTDEQDHRDFFRDALGIIAETYPEKVHAAARNAAASLSDPAAAHGLLSFLDIPATPQPSI